MNKNDGAGIIRNSFFQRMVWGKGFNTHDIMDELVKHGFLNADHRLTNKFNPDLPNFSLNLSDKFRNIEKEIIERLKLQENTELLETLDIIYDLIKLATPTPTKLEKLIEIPEGFLCRWKKFESQKAKDKKFSFKSIKNICDSCFSRVYKHILFTPLTQKEIYDLFNMVCKKNEAQRTIKKLIKDELILFFKEQYFIKASLIKIFGNIAYSQHIDKSSKNIKPFNQKIDEILNQQEKRKQELLDENIIVDDSMINNSFILT